MRKFVLVCLASLSLSLGLVGSASATPSPENYPTNPNACIGRSTVGANAIFKDADPAKFRDEQARGETYLGVPAGEPGRRDDIANARADHGCGELAP
jgi:hypothetical protein